MSFSVRTTDVEFEVAFAILQFCITALTLFGLGFFGVLGPGGGGGLQKPPPFLHKSESIDVIDMKLGG